MLSSVLLEGPPGTGKTFVSQALAYEAGCDFLSLTGGVFGKPEHVQALFADARKL